ncbi:sensor histidine kinase [Smaragdicoccus niigatensis]|uniref:sensor histidine kinase n=1 Tax=Smaragdicoccus niigatensis TaxID=359359 RepID=UPI00037E87E8|nr:histidine kinase [Smaragdicoccus niigatensis]
MLRRQESAVIAGGVLLVLVAVAVTGKLPPGLHECLTYAVVLGIGLPLLWWRRHPAAALVVACTVVMAGIELDLDPGNSAFPLFFALAAIFGFCFRGRAAWIAAGAFVLWIAAVYWRTGDDSPGFLVLLTPGYLGGVVLRLRDETAKQLEIRRTELEAERELFAQLSVRNERARIAAELHDIIGHALSVMVVQAAAGQRLVDADPALAGNALATIADSARRGREDLHKLVGLLGGEEVGSPDLSMIEEIVGRATASGLKVTCRFEGDRDGVAAEAAQLGFRVVQEGLTNALRYAPGAAVRVLVRGAGRSLIVRVENDPAVDASPSILGVGSGLRGLRERVQQLGGRVVAGPTLGGGWVLEANL